MPASFEVTGSDTTIVFKFTVPTTKAQALVETIANYLWRKGYGNHGTPSVPISYSSLTNQQKLDIVFLHVREVLLNIVKIDAYQKSTAIAVADVEVNSGL